jgi:hypothetical protein
MGNTPGKTLKGKPINCERNFIMLTENIFGEYSNTNQQSMHLEYRAKPNRYLLCPRKSCPTLGMAYTASIQSCRGLHNQQLMLQPVLKTMPSSHVLSSLYDPASNKIVRHETVRLYPLCCTILFLDLCALVFSCDACSFLLLEFLPPFSCCNLSSSLLFQLSKTSLCSIVDV